MDGYDAGDDRGRIRRTGPGDTRPIRHNSVNTPPRDIAIRGSA